MSDDVQIKGLKKSDFKGPDEFFGEGKAPDNLPESIRLYIRGKQVDMRGKDLRINVYRLVAGLGTKERKDWVGEVQGPNVPDDRDIALRFGPGRYVWIAKWMDPVDGEKGLVSDEVHVAEDAREAHLAWKAQNAGISAPGVPGKEAAMISPAAGALNDPLAVLRLVQLGEDRALDNLERMQKILAGRPSQAIEGPQADAHKKAMRIIDEALEYKAKAIEAAKPAPPAKEEEVIPPFLKPFMPLIEKNLDKLLGGGAVAEGIKEVVLSTEEFAAIMANPQQMEEMMKALQLRFGPEKAERALRALLDDSPKADETFLEKAAGKVASKVAKAAVRGARR